MKLVTLDNGLRVIVLESRTAPLVSVWCWYRVGSKDEAPGLTGASHWVEHMNFKGTTNIPRDQVKGIIERFGGMWNGYTWIDQTTYLETASRDALDQMLFIESERMASCLYHPDDVESERTVIISELQGGENDPEQLLDIEVTAAAFKAHPYRHPTIGWLSDLQSMGRDDLYNHYLRYYAPNNATLVVVGDIDADDALRRVEQRFGSIEARPMPARVPIVEPFQAGERRVHLAKEGTTAYLKLAYHAPAVDDPDFFPMVVLDAVMTGAKGLNLWTSFRGAPPQRSARLYRALVDRRLASAVGGAILPTQQPFLYSLSLTAQDGTPAAALEEAALAEVERTRAQGVTDAELARAKYQLVARLVFEADSVTNIAHQLGYFDVISSLDTYASIRERIADVTLEQVGRAAQRYLASSNRTLGWFEPLATQSRSVMLPAARNDETAPGAPAVLASGANGLRPVRQVLPNGVVVTVKRSTTNAATAINAAVKAGVVYDPTTAPGLANFLSRVIDRGTARRSAHAIAEELDERGVALTTGVSRHTLSVDCTCLVDDFERILDVVGDVLIRPTFPDDEAATRRGEIVTAIRQDEDNPAVMAVEGLMRLLYRDGHPYGRRAKGAVNEVERIDPRALREFHRARFTPPALSLVVVGDVDPARAVAAAANVFGDWRGSPPVNGAMPPVIKAPSRQQLVIPMMNKTQADIAYGFTTIVRSDPNYYALWLLNNVLGQYALGGRLGDSIRERQGMAYYVFSSFEASQAEGPLVIRAGVASQNVERAIESIDREVSRLASEGVGDDELAESKRYLIGSLPRMLETNGGIAAFLQSAEFFGLGADYDRRLPDLLGAVTRDQVNWTGGWALNPSNASVVVAGPYASDLP